MYSGWVGLLVVILLVSGCATGNLDSLALHRLDDVEVLPRDARIGITEFTVCGGNYLDKFKRSRHEQDPKAVFYRTCTELGHPHTFSDRLRLRLEEKLGSKLIVVKAAKSFKPKRVMRSSDKLGLDYVIGGDLLYLGESKGAAVVSALFYLVRVADGKTMVLGRVMKDGELGKVLKVIDEVADELFEKAYVN